METVDIYDVRHDMGADIMPASWIQCNSSDIAIRDIDVACSADVYRDYWRDVGTLDSFYDAHMDLIAVAPVFNLYNSEWPVYTGYTGLPPAKFVHAGPGRLGHAADSIVSPGVIVSGATVTGSVLSPGVKLNSWSSVSRSVLMDEVYVGRHAQIDRAIIDKNVVVEEGARVGLDPEHDHARGSTITKSELTVVPKGVNITSIQPRY